MQFYKFQAGFWIRVVKVWKNFLIFAFTDIILLLAPIKSQVAFFKKVESNEFRIEFYQISWIIFGWSQIELIKFESIFIKNFELIPIWLHP